MNATAQTYVRRLTVLVMFLGLMCSVPRAAFAVQPAPAGAATAVHHGGEANLVVPDLSTVEFRGWNGRTLLMGGLAVCALGLLFGLMTFTELRNMPVHASMLEVSYRVNGVTVFHFASIEPVGFLGGSGVRMRYDYVSGIGITKKGDCVMRVIDRKLYAMKLESLADRYYDSVAPEFERLVTSLRGPPE